LGGDERSQSIDDNDGLQQNGKFIYISSKKLKNDALSASQKNRLIVQSA
jgi:hypothetical protein